ncbi:MAG: hypothetical protein ACEQSU_14230 [Microgenomates group bacterium]
MSDMSVAPARQTEPMRAKSLPNAAVIAVAIPPPTQRTLTKASDTQFFAQPKPAVTAAWELAATKATPEGIELDLIPFAGDGAILSDDLPKAPPPPAPKEPAMVIEKKEPRMDLPHAFGLDPHPKTEQVRSIEAARVYEEERVISNAPRPEPVKPTWEQATPVKAKFDALNDVEIAEILD